MVRKKKEKEKEREKKDELTANDIGVEGAKAMSEILKENTTLTELDLGSEEEERKEKKIKKREKRRMNNRQLDLG